MKKEKLSEEDLSAFALVKRLLQFTSWSFNIVNKSAQWGQFLRKG